MMLRVLVCDDSGVIRVTLKQMIESDPDLQVIDVAKNGKEAIEKAALLKPDVITMDIFMPVMDGITALKKIVADQIAPVIMISGASQKDGQAVVSAIEAGAFDFIAKPDETIDLEYYSTDIIRKIKEAAASNIYSKIKTGFPGSDPINNPKENPERSARPLVSGLPSMTGGGHGFKAVVLGISTGGPKSIYEVLPLLPSNLNAAVIVVQHMPAAFITVFAKQINKKTQMPCVESSAGMPLAPGNIYIARGGFQFSLLRRTGGDIVIRHMKEPKSPLMPSVDFAMNAVLEIFGKDTIGVLMTGMGRDGAEGMLQISRAGGLTIAESAETAIVFGMPQESIKNGGAQMVLPHYKIAAEIIKVTQ